MSRDATDADGFALYEDAPKDGLERLARQLETPMMKYLDNLFYDHANITQAAFEIAKALNRIADALTEERKT